MDVLAGIRYIRGYNLKILVSDAYLQVAQSRGWNCGFATNKVEQVSLYRKVFEFRRKCKRLKIAAGFSFT